MASPRSPSEKVPRSPRRTAQSRPCSQKSPNPQRRQSATGGDQAISVIAPELGEGTPRNDDSDIDLVDIPDAVAAAKASDPQQAGPYSREEEIEKLRTGGSMTQNQAEVSRVRSLNRIQMGTFEIEPWYFPPLPSILHKRRNCLHLGILPKLLRLFTIL